jgi:hypothetical protein
MKLTELDPKFLKIEDPHHFKWVDELAGADGIEFLCPLCFTANAGPVGTHVVICWRPHVLQTVHPIPGRWEFQGRGYEDLTLVAGSSSVLLTKGCCAHFFVRNGEIQIV